MADFVKVEEIQYWDGPVLEGMVAFTDGERLHFEHVKGVFFFCNELNGVGRKFQNNAYKRAVAAHIERD